MTLRMNRSWRTAAPISRSRASGTRIKWRGYSILSPEIAT